MPILANSFVRCPFPVNFDPYGGCEHQCAYCFANRHIRKDARDKFDASKEKGESVEQLKAFCEGKRTSRLRWIDWKIPVCIGRNTDPFQPREAREKKTLACLKYLAKTGYPFIVTTKGVMMAEDREYREVLKDCNCVFQFSMCCPKQDAMERGAPCYERRLNALHVLSGIVPRVIARWQPLFLEWRDDCIRQLPRLKQAGAYGILCDTAYLKRPLAGCCIREGNLFCYPSNIIKADYTKIRAAAHARGLVFMSSEKRQMSDYITCCIGSPLPGFRPSKCNAPFYWLARDEYETTSAMQLPGTGEAFQNIYTGRKSFAELRKHTFAELMLDYAHKAGVNY